MIAGGLPGLAALRRALFPVSAIQPTPSSVRRDAASEPARPADLLNRGATRLPRPRRRGPLGAGLARRVAGRGPGPAAGTPRGGQGDARRGASGDGRVWAGDGRARWAAGGGRARRRRCWEGAAAVPEGLRGVRAFEAGRRRRFRARNRGGGLRRGAGAQAGPPGGGAGGGAGRIVGRRRVLRPGDGNGRSNGRNGTRCRDGHGNGNGPHVRRHGLSRRRRPLLHLGPLCPALVPGVGQGEGDGSRSARAADAQAGEARCGGGSEDVRGDEGGV
ncbi:hypothetical protein DFJ74DRAFT_657208 [Hyaloraphidium curvatum]|nr:hypothetical protein DFJ74DRAFT_657208 [Hyaloraphidium curvatum]